MPCHSTASTLRPADRARASTRSTPRDPEHPSLRAGDADRTATADLLGRALSTGHLDLQEYDTRLSHAFTARNHGDLTALTADLPATAVRDPHDRTRRQHRARLGLAVHGAAALFAVTICWLIWGAIAITHEPTYLWPIWPTLGAAAGVLPHVAALRLKTASGRRTRLA